MDRLLVGYDVNPSTWVYLSSLMIIAIYFKFARFWCVRNLDLILLVALAPGVLMVEHTRLLQLEMSGQSLTLIQIGYVWLFTVSLILLIRLLIDPAMVRRPLLAPNLSVGGLTFMGAALLIFLMTNVVTREVNDANLIGSQKLDLLLGWEEEPPEEQPAAEQGAAFALLHLVGRVPSAILIPADDDQSSDQRRRLVHETTAKTMAILSHLAIVAGIIYIGYRHFGNIHTGIAAASLYLLLPYTAHLVARVDYTLPAALIVWTLAAYRRPLVAGILMGVAVGTIYYPIFLFPLWIAFYWQRGAVRFLVGGLLVLVFLAGTQVLVTGTFDSFLGHLTQSFNWLTMLGSTKVQGFWEFNPTAYRIPVVVAFVALSVSFALWPMQKNLGTLLSCSAAIMLATQFFHPDRGGLYVGWYLPLVLLTTFRPNLEDRVALTVLGEFWLPRRLSYLRPFRKAA